MGHLAPALSLQLVVTPDHAVYAADPLNHFRQVVALPPHPILSPAAMEELHKEQAGKTKVNFSLAPVYKLSLDA